MYYEVDLSGPAIVTGPMAAPAELMGLAPESLLDLSAAINPCPSRYAGRGFWPIRREVPEFDPATQRLSEQANAQPDIASRTVVETQAVVTLTPEEIAARDAAALPPVPMRVTNFQARAALIAAGLFDAVNSALMALPPASVERQAWEYANELTRDGSLVNSMAAQLGLTTVQLDNLFRAAGEIEA